MQKLAGPLMLCVVLAMLPIASALGVAHARTPTQVFDDLSSPSHWATGVPRPYSYAAERKQLMEGNPFFVGVIAVGFAGGGPTDFVGLTVTRTVTIAQEYLRDKIKSHRGVRYGTREPYRWTEVQHGKDQDCDPIIARCYEAVLAERVGTVVATIRGAAPWPASAGEVRRLARLEEFAATRVRQAE